MKKIKNFNDYSFKINEMNDDKLYRVWQTLSSICNGTNQKGESYLANSWDENGEIDPEFKEKLSTLKIYLNNVEYL